MGVAQVRRIKVLEEENRKLKQLEADLTLDVPILKEGGAGKLLSASRRGSA